MRDLVGWRLSDAIRFAEKAGVFWEVKDVPPLPPTEADDLFDAYFVDTQTPANGRVIFTAELATAR